MKRDMTSPFWQGNHRTRADYYCLLEILWHTLYRDRRRNQTRVCHRGRKENSFLIKPQWYLARFLKRKIVCPTRPWKCKRGTILKPEETHHSFHLRLFVGVAHIYINFFFF